MQSCSTEEALMQNEAIIKTVSREQAIQFLQQNPLRTSSNKATKTSNSPNYDAITQEEISNSDQFLTVIPLLNNDKTQHSRIVLLTVNDTLKSAIFTMYPDGKQKTKDFSGRIMITNLSGEFKNGFRVKDGFLVSQFVLKINDTKSTGTNKSASDDLGTILNEVIIPPRKKATIQINYIYDWSSPSDNSNDDSLIWDFEKYGGGGGASAEAVVEEEDPCAQIKGLLDYDSTESINLKSNINWLKDKVNAGVNNKEAGVEVTKVMNPDETFKYEFTQVSANDQFSISMSTNYDNVGGFHSHPSDGDAMFSFGDIRFLLSVYDEARSYRKEEAFTGLVAKDAAGNTNVYMLKIENIESLRTQINSVWNSEKYTKFQNEKERIKAIHLDQAIKYSKSNGNLEKSFLEQFKDFGIELFKADATTDHFDKLTLNNSTVTPTPCN
ncbi:hypothetical protein FPG59_15100 [Flavobacterium sp. FPG59]|jgi:hypothetical protein|nr:hypothetical protein FPG59_15100 [Flavobacterium sp. FPG59]